MSFSRRTFLTTILTAGAAAAGGLFVKQHNDIIAADEASKVDQSTIKSIHEQLQAIQNPEASKAVGEALLRAYYPLTLNMTSGLETQEMREDLYGVCKKYPELDFGKMEKLGLATQNLALSGSKSANQLYGLLPSPTPSVFRAVMEDEKEPEVPGFERAKMESKDLDFYLQKQLSQDIGIGRG